MAGLAMTTSGAAKAAVNTHYPVVVVNAICLIKVEVSFSGAEITEDDRILGTRLTKTARNTKSQ